jgi:hypothetical protein
VAAAGGLRCVAAARGGVPLEADALGCDSNGSSSSLSEDEEPSADDEGPSPDAPCDDEDVAGEELAEGLALGGSGLPLLLRANGAPQAAAPSAAATAAGASTPAAALASGPEPPSRSSSDPDDDSSSLSSDVNEAASALVSASSSSSADELPLGADEEDSGDEDAGSEDSGDEDAGSEDSGDEDAGSEDSGDEDAGSKDSGDEDAGSEDAGDEDAGSEDSGDEDAGSELHPSAAGGAPAACLLRLSPLSLSLSLSLSLLPLFPSSPSLLSPASWLPLLALAAGDVEDGTPSELSDSPELDPLAAGPSEAPLEVSPSPLLLSSTDETPDEPSSPPSELASSELEDALPAPTDACSVAARRAGSGSGSRAATATCAAASGAAGAVPPAASAVTAAEASLRLCDAGGCVAEASWTGRGGVAA